MAQSLPDLAALLESWRLAMRAEGKAAGTVKTYDTGVRLFLRWCDTTGTPAQLTKPAVQAFLADLRDGGAQPATAIARHKAVTQFAAWLAREDELPTDPLQGLKRPQADHKVVEALTDDQLRLLLKACQGKTLKDRRDEAIVRMMAETGLRAGEVIGMQTTDVDLHRGLITVRRGKGGKGRVVPIGPQVTACVDRYLRMRRSHRLTETGPLWVGAGGRTFAYHGLRESLRDRAVAAGVEGFHLHLLRHTAATRWLRAGGSEQGLMSVAGWSTRAMLDRYTGASAAERAAAEARGLNLGDL